MQVDPSLASSVTALSWGVGSAATLALSYRSWLAYRKTNNILSAYIAKFTLIIGISFIFYAVPYFVFTDPYTLKFVQATGQIVSYISYIYQALILWHMGFRGKLSKWAFVVPTALLGLVGTYLEFQSKRVYQISPGVMDWARPQAALWLEVFFIATLILPIGLLFIKEAIGQTQRAAQAKSLGIGLAYFGVGIAQIMQDTLEDGIDTLENGLVGLIFFSLLLIILITPRAWIRQKMLRAKP